MSAGEIPVGIEEDRKLPEERFRNEGDARQLCIMMVSADNKRAAWRNKINGVVDGNRPINQQSLKGKNMGWFPNVNYREMEGLIQAQQTPFYDLVSEAKPCIEVDLDLGANNSDLDAWETSIEKNFTWLLMKRWRKGMNFHIPLHQREMLIHGIGAHVWPRNEENWIPRTHKTGAVLFPDDAPVNFDEEGKYFMLRDFVPGEDVYGFIRNEAAAIKLGWKPDNVWKALVLSSKSAQNGNMPNMTGEMTRFQSQMKRGDLGYSMSRQAGLWLDHLFVKEYEGGISHYIICENAAVGDYLFKKRNRFKVWSDVLLLFPYDIGDGTLHSIRGLGARTKDFFELSNRTKNMMAAQIILGATVPLQQTGSVDPDKLKLLKLGMMSILPQNVTIAQGFKFPDLNNGPIAFQQTLDDTLRKNNESYLSGTPEPKDRETAQSFTMRARDAAQVSKGAHGLYSSNLCQFYDRTLRAVIKASKSAGSAEYVTMAKEFRDRCRKDKVPDNAFDHIYEVREVTSTGAGSASARIQALMTIMQYIYPATSEDRKINIEHDLVAALVSGSKVERYARSLSDSNLPNEDDSFATLESDALAKGGNAQVAPRQNHVKHIGNHLGKAQEILTALQQGQMAPEEALAGIQAIGQHVGAHLQQLQGNKARQADYDNLRKEWLALSAIADKLQQQVQESQQAAQQPSPQDQISDNLKVGLAKVQSDSQIKTAKFQHDAALKTQKQLVDTRLKVNRASVDNRIALARAAAQPRKQLTNG